MYKKFPDTIGNMIKLFLFDTETDIFPDSNFSFPSGGIELWLFVLSAMDRYGSLPINQLLAVLCDVVLYRCYSINDLHHQAQ
jgi:hypothetical protein